MTIEKDYVLGRLDAMTKAQREYFQYCWVRKYPVEAELDTEQRGCTPDEIEVAFNRLLEHEEIVKLLHTVLIHQRTPKV